MSGSRFRSRRAEFCVESFKPWNRPRTLDCLDFSLFKPDGDRQPNAMRARITSFFSGMI